MRQRGESIMTITKQQALDILSDIESDINSYNNLEDNTAAYTSEQDWKDMYECQRYREQRIEQLRTFIEGLPE
jgi:hypothetical protein